MLAPYATRGAESKLWYIHPHYAHTQAWTERVNNSGGAYLTPALLDGRWMVRVSIGAISTEREHVESLWKLIRREAEVG